MSHKRSVRTLGHASAFALALVVVSPAQAQDRTGTPQDDTAQTQPEPAAPEPAGEADIVVTGQFLDTGASSATKLDIAVLDTPFSVASYNNNFLKAIETTNVSDLYRYMTGIQRAGNTGYDIAFRGFKTSGNDRNAILTDGLPGLAVRFGSPPTIGVDHIELVKGPTSVLYGQAQPGGFINIISKKPKTQTAFEVGLKGNLGVGDFDRARGGLLQLDFTGPVDEGGNLAVRFVAEGGYNKGFRDFAYEKPIYVSPSLTWKLGDRTSVTVQGEYRWIKTHYDTYLVAPNRDVSKIAAINTNYQEKNDYLIERGAIGNIFFNHQFSDALKFSAGYRYVDHVDTQNNFDVVGFLASDPLNTITRRARGQENKRTYSFVDTNLTAKVGTFGIKHTVLLGFSGGQETASLNRTRFYNCAATPAPACSVLNMNIYNPVHGVAPAPETFPLFNTGQSANLNWRYTTQNSLGFYASDLIEIADWLKLLGGVRYADERQTLADLRITTFVPTAKKDHKTLPLAGIVVQPVKQLSLYASYSTSFVPVPGAQQDIFGLNPFIPTEANSREGGVKTELFDRKLLLTAAYFDIKKKNTINTFTCPANLAALNAFIAANAITIPSNAPRDAAGNLIPGSGTCSNQLGGERSRGFEVEVSASPMRNWQITSGFSHTNARVTASNIPGQTGARLTNAPRDAFNIWSRYDFTDGALANLGVGVGVSYIGDRAGLLPTALVDARPAGGTLPLASYTTVDLGLYYKVGETLDLTLKATNLLDERYIESAGFTGDIQLVPGTPRLLTLTARTRF